jgi:hypothetical protein
MIFFSYTRIIARISLIPLVIVGAVFYIIARNSTIIAEGIMNALIGLAIWFGISFGAAGGVITAVALIRRSIRHKTARAVPIREDIPVVSYTLYPERKHAIEEGSGQGTTINGIPIEEYTSKLNVNSRYGKRS